MSKLLRADFRRLFKSKFFWFSTAVMAFLGALPVDRYLANRAGFAAGATEPMWYLEDEFFNYLIAQFFIITILTALFVGAEYANGTLRNKIVVGQKRSAIYLSNLVTLVSAIAILTAVYLAIAIGVGIPLLGMFSCGLKLAVFYILLAFCLSAAVCAIMLTVAMLCTNRTYSAIACIMLVLAHLFAGSAITGALNEPEFYDGYSILNTDTGELTEQEREPNPNYVSGTKRQILETASDIVPGCQLIKICDLEVEDFSKLVIYDLLIFAVCTGAGIVIFKRKDLK